VGFAVKRYFGIAAFVATLMLVSLPASADSNDNFSNVQLSGGNVSGTVAGGFTFTQSSDTFSNISLQFNSSIGTVDAYLSSAHGIVLGKNLVELLWKTKVGRDTVWCSITLNTLTNQFLEAGWLAKGNHYGGFDYMSAPEGDATLAYLLLSGVAVFAGILLSGKQRRVTT
jgi:hypothetical protein